MLTLEDLGCGHPRVELVYQYVGTNLLFPMGRESPKNEQGEPGSGDLMTKTLIRSLNGVGWLVGKIEDIFI